MTRKQQNVLDHAAEAVDAEIDEALKSLRVAGLNPIDGIKFLRVHFGIPIGEAKKRVHRSGAWRHMDKDVERLHGEAEAALDAEISARSGK